MRGHFLAVSALLALSAACSGRTTRNADETPAAAGSRGVAEGGSAGGGASAGSGAAPAGTGGEAVSACDCVAQEISWWREGGAEKRRENHIAPCNAYDYGEGPVGSVVMPQCSSLLEGCGKAFGVDDINAALLHPDVVDALEHAPQLFGADPRAIGGEVDHIEVGGKVIEIGYECEQRSECEIPQGIYAFGFLLGTLTAQEVGGKGCEIP
jgi:hypothetical protein